MSDGTTPEIKQRFEIKLTLIRHGAAKSNLEHRYLGTTDEPLSAEGKQALFIKKESGLYPNPDKLFISPMLRCRQTAEILFPDVASWEIPEWTEMDFGQFECKNYKELNGNTAYQAWIDSEGELPSLMERAGNTFGNGYSGDSGSFLLMSEKEIVHTLSRRQWLSFTAERSWHCAACFLEAGILIINENAAKGISVTSCIQMIK